MEEEKKGMMFILSSPSGAGKTTLTKKLAENNKNLVISISHTTRKPRPKEVNAKDYHFVSKEEFDSLVKKNSFLYEFEVRDKYSNSGIVAFIFLQIIEKRIKISEYVISCRALGRGLEYLFLKHAIKKFDNEVYFLYKKKERNEPFINFLKKISFNRINFNNNKISFNKFNKIVSGYSKYVNVKFY